MNYIPEDKKKKIAELKSQSRKRRFEEGRDASWGNPAADTNAVSFAIFIVAVWGGLAFLFSTIAKEHAQVFMYSFACLVSTLIVAFTAFFIGKCFIEPRIIGPISTSPEIIAGRKEKRHGKDINDSSSGPLPRYALPSQSRVGSEREKSESLHLSTG